MRKRRTIDIARSPFQPAVGAYVHNILARTPLVGGALSGIRQIEDVETVKRLAARAVGIRWPPQESKEDDLEGSRMRLALRKYLRIEGLETRRVPPREPIASNLAVLGSALVLEPAEAEVLAFLLAAHQSKDLADLTGAFGEVTLVSASRLVSAATGVPLNKVGQALSPSSRLCSSGLVVVGDGTNQLLYKLTLKDGLLDLIASPQRVTREQILCRFLSFASPPTLSWSDFDHMGARVGVARDLLAAAVKRARRGVNLLFYGGTGTGKSELARLLSRELGLSLYAIGKADTEGAPATASERLSSLLLAHQLLGESRALLLFDEFEDLFEWDSRDFFRGGGHGTARMSKQWFNDALENNPVPTIWVTNRTSGIDTAFLRRYLYALEFEPLGAKQRGRMLRRHLGPQSPVSDADVDAIADRYAAGPAQLGSAVTAARLLCDGEEPDRATIEKLLAPMEKLVTGRDPSRRPVFETSTYRIEALNCSENLVAIADGLVGWKPGPNPGVSMCLYGPPGAGKSEYVKYLGHRMGRRVVYRRASDIQSCWVGETEKNIAQAFREAQDDDALLLFDEVDSFLRDRKLAERSWEVSFVNEFLQQLEFFQGIVACTTNLWRDLDEASLRRFVLKLEFRYLKREQALVLFRSVFAPLLKSPLRGTDEPFVLAGVSQLGSLTPGDFAAVARRATALRERLPFQTLLDLLATEVRVKGAPVRSVGFGPKA